VGVHNVVFSELELARSIQEARAKLEEKKKELNAIEKTYNDRLQVTHRCVRVHIGRSVAAAFQALQAELDKETDARKLIESDLAKVKKELEETIKDRPSKARPSFAALCATDPAGRQVNELKNQIEQVKAEKLHFQKQLTVVRKELARLQQAYQDGEVCV
jgi:archaellum component FlaC